jgi:hypothetical protein
MIVPWKMTFSDTFHHQSFHVTFYSSGHMTTHSVTFSYFLSYILTIRFDEGESHTGTTNWSVKPQPCVANGKSDYMKWVWSHLYKIGPVVIVIVWYVNLISLTSRLRKRIRTQFGPFHSYVDLELQNVATIV